MTDLANNPVSTPSVGRGITRSDQVRKRFAAEARFRFLGLCAVLVACSFLVILLSSIVFEARHAFTYNYVNLELDLSAGTVDARAPGNADFRSIGNAAISESFPFVSGRSDRRKARGLLAAAIDVDIRRMVLDDMSLLGDTETLRLPVSDVADLYLKGLEAQLRVVADSVPVTFSRDGDDLLMETSGDGFIQLLTQIRDELRADRNVLENRIATRERGIAPLRERLAGQQAALETTTESDGRTRLESSIEDLTAELSKREAEVASINTQLDAITKKLATDDSAIQLSNQFASIFMRTQDGIVKVTELSPQRLRGTELVPFKEASDIVSRSVSISVIDTPEANRKFSDLEVALVEAWKDSGRIESGWNTRFFTAGASREPERAGIWGAVIGSFFTMLVTLLLSFPIGVGAAIYLEEFAPKNRMTDLIEVNINNLAAVPSIVFGLLGLAVFLNLFGFQRSIPLVGGMVLALMTLPTIIIASRAALKAVPPSIREAAMGVGASRIQTVFHHVLPLAMPGILTGTIIGMAQALGETAPLLMIGMVAFIADIPSSAFEPATVLPVQVYMWADFPEVAFRQKTSAAIVVLLGFLVIMNAIAVILRKRFERRW